MLTSLHAASTGAAALDLSPVVGFSSVEVRALRGDRDVVWSRSPARQDRPGSPPQHRAPGNLLPGHDQRAVPDRIAKLGGVPEFINWLDNTYRPDTA